MWTKALNIIQQGEDEISDQIPFYLHILLAFTASILFLLHLAKQTSPQKLNMNSRPDGDEN